MAGCQCVANRIEQNEGHAVGEYQEERKSNGIGNECIAARLAGAGIIPIDLADVCTVYLVCANRLGGISADGSAETGEVLLDAFSVIAAAKAEIETPPRAGRYASVTGAYICLEGKGGKTVKGIGHDTVVVGDSLHLSKGVPLTRAVLPRRQMESLA